VVTRPEPRIDLEIQLLKLVQLALNGAEIVTQRSEEARHQGGGLTSIVGICLAELIRLPEWVEMDINGYSLLRWFVNERDRTPVEFVQRNGQAGVVRPPVARSRCPTVGCLAASRPWIVSCKGDPASNSVADGQISISTGTMSPENTF
jgi:hypothetical protein